MNAVTSTQSSVVAVPMLISMEDLSLAKTLMMKTLVMNLSVFVRLLGLLRTYTTFALC